MPFASSSEGHKLASKSNFSQTMLRIKDPSKSIPFYESLGMTMLLEKHFPQWKFSLYFLGCLDEEGGEVYPGDEAGDDEKSLFVNSRHRPVLELTHNHGTEDDEALSNGNEEWKKGFGHIGFLVDDVEKACDALEGLGHGFKKRPGDGNMKGLAFATDPDGYWVEIIKRGGYDADATPFYFEEK